jgi:hypothetical protein
MPLIVALFLLTITYLSPISNATTNSSLACEITIICNSEFNNVGFNQNIIPINHANKIKIRKM